MVASSSPSSSLCVSSAASCLVLVEMMGQSQARPVPRSAWAQILSIPVLALSVSLLFLRRSVYPEAE